MGCEVKHLPGGVTAIICARGRNPRAGRPACSVCGTRPGTRLCDAPVGSGRRPSGLPLTCDAPLCHLCAAHVSHGRDLCPAHAPTKG